MSENKKKGADELEDFFDLQKIISRVLDHWKLFLACIVSCVILSVLFFWYSTALYKVHAQILVQDDQNNNGSFSFLGGSQMQQLGGLFGIKSNVNNELGILETRDLIEKVVKDMNLDVAYYSKGVLKSEELYNKTPFHVDFYPKNDSIQASSIDVGFSKSTDNAFTIKSSSVDVPVSEAKFGDSLHTSVGTLVFSKTGKLFEGESFTVVLKSTDEVVDNLIQQLTAEIKDEQSSIIALTLNTSVPAQGEDILGKFILSYVQRNLNEKNKISDSTLAFIRGRVDIVSRDLNNIEANIQGFKQKNKLANIDEQSRALVSNASEYYNKLNDVEIQLNIVKTMLSGVREDTKRPIPALINTDPNFVSLVTKYNTLISQRDKLLLSTTENNPLVESVNIQLNMVRDDMIKNLENQQRALEITRNNIVGQNSQINNMVSNVPVQEREYVDLSRERDVKQALYLFLLQQEETTAITKASNIPSASVIAVPKADYKPYFPSKMMVMAIGALAGFALPFGFIVLKYTFNNKIESREDVTNNTNCPILAEIGHSDDISGVLKEEHSRTVLAEQFRIFRTNMDFLTSQKKCPKILLTSSMTGEGKSFVAVNLAQVYAYSGKKVLLMEMDLRKPKLSLMLKIPNDNGFSNYMISNEQDVNRFIKKIEPGKNIYLLGSGPIPPNPAELLMSEKVSKMFDDLSSNFDIIIIDSPPIGAVADSQILNRFSDVNLYIIRQSYSFKNSMNIINDIIENKKFPNLYIVVNDVKKGASYKYGYGYGSGYGYGYTVK
ncbi:MAG TPA: polysaccharide biosynthesis tyrosine autokinase [Parafilimonas sp.]|nr:polysaccharide biosynthesis tyrosine autokinase [Parafilimonas sp.]